MLENGKRTQRIRDPVHGLIVFGGGADSHRDETDRIAWKLLNTPEFQRLRRIRQLGFSDLVFPGATHSRFAHSIGVYHMARQLADVIARREERDRDRERVILLAALLHDIGHGPFSHAFESTAASVGLYRTHEDWGAEIVLGDTGVNRVLRDVDAALPKQIANHFAKDRPKDIYSSIFSSQFDADRLDYLQRDRRMTGVAFGRIDPDWLLDCLEVGKVTIGTEHLPDEAPCFYLGPKGIQVAEEYLEARSRLYRMVYMHKTTRAAEKMLDALFKAVASAGMNGHEPTHLEPVLRYLTTKPPNLDYYLALDDSTVWAALSIYSEHSDQHISTLAQRLRNRDLYKCLDIGICDKPNGNLFLRFRRVLKELSPAWRDKVIFEDATVMPYKWYNFSDLSALNKVLVKTQDNKGEPEDIASVSDIVNTLRDKQRIQRVYAPGRDEMVDLRKILEEENK